MFEAHAFFLVNSELDQEEWPLMELTNVSVFSSKRNGPAELEDLLDVQDRGPFRIEGNLTVIPSELKDIIRTKNLAKLYREPLIITKVMIYSIQQFEDGDIKIWALGKCGWYSITPSPRYEPIFKTMVEKGKLWGFLQDKYCEEFSGKGDNIEGSVEDLYASFPNSLAASQLFEKHYRYLLFEMCGIRADTDMWPRTPLFRYFASKYALQLRAIRRSMACASDRMDNPIPVKQETPEPLSPIPSAYALPPSSSRPKVANVDTRAEDFLSIKHKHPPSSITYDWTETPPTQADDDDDDDDDDDGDEVGDITGVGSVYIRSPVKPPVPVNSRPPARVPVHLQAPSSSETINENGLGDTLKNTLAAAALNQKRVLDDPPSPCNGVPTAKRPCILTAVAGSSAFSSSLSTLPLVTITNPGLQPGTNKPPCSATSPEATRTNGPGDGWECEISGCNYNILDADTAESLQLIEKHYAEHAQLIKQAMDAIGGNVLPSRPHHVDNLLARIGQMARKWAASNPP